MYISVLDLHYVSIKSDDITFCCYLVCQSVHQHSLTYPASQPTQPPPQSDIGYDVIKGAESLSQSRRLYYDKVDAPGFLKDRSSSLSPPLSPSQTITLLEVVLPIMLCTAMLRDARSNPPQLQTGSLQGGQVTQIQFFSTKIFILKRSSQSPFPYSVVSMSKYIVFDWLYNGLI